MDNQNMLYITVDGDGIGRIVGQSVLSDDEQGLIEISKRINAAQDFMSQTIQKMGGVVIELGGDELTAKIPQEALDEIETMRGDVEHSFGFTITVGIGQSLSQAAKSLLVGKSNGKDQVVMYGPEVDDQLKAMSERVGNGQGSEEDNKIAESYLPPKEDDMKESEKKPVQDHDEDCEYCKETEDQENGPSDGDEDMPVEGEDHEHTGDDCEYCQQMGEEQGPDEVGDDEAPADEDGEQEADDGSQSDEENDDASEDDHEHTGDDCEYCQEASDEDPSQEEVEAADGDSIAPEGVEGQDDQVEDEAEAGNQEAQDEHTQEGMKQIAQAIETEDGGDEAAQLADVDDSDLAVGDHMEGGTSRPEDYDDSDDHTLGLSEDEADGDQGPDLGSVLKEGLDSHADNIQKEKVAQMVGQALDGFKANKKVLEMAKEQAPDFYMASISMLKAMIEMAKMLGLSQDGDDEDAGGDETEEQLETDDQGMDQDPSQSAAPAPQAQEGQQPPKPKGQSAKV